ncbi:MAG: PAS domain-containing protein [Sedimentisphaerales bacterium]|nr:PAS domain-containing protein [Sedimentisphaerales bacterium]
MRFRLREKILLITITTFLLAIGANTYITGQIFRKEYSTALQSKMEVIANILKSKVERLLELGIAVGDIEGFEIQCQDALQKHPDLAYVMVVRTDGQIIFHNDTTYHGSMIDDPEILKALRQNRQTSCMSQAAKHTYYNAIVPVGNDLNRTNVAVVVGFPTTLIDNKIQELRHYSYMAALVSLAIAIFFLLASLSISVTKPMSKLVATIQQIRESSDLSKRVGIISRDELGELAHSFNQMTEDLQKTTTSIDNLNTEIENRKSVELSLRRSENKYRTLLKNIPQKIFYKDIDSVYVLCNESYAEDLGITPDKIIGKTDYDFFPEHLAKKYIRDDRKVMDSGEREDLEESYTLNGRELIISTSKSPVRDENGNIIGIFGIFWDITDQKKAERRQNQLLEQLESVNQELKDFAYVVSHDLKAPLRGIKTLANWLVSDYADKLDQEGKEQLDLLSSRVDRMHNLIEGILQYSRIGRENEQQVKMDLNKIVPEIIDMLALPENIAIIIENQLPVIECEQTRIMQVFQNLLSNAVKYMDKPQGRINIECVDEGDCWKFSIADNGPGIEEKYFNKIFQIFQTLSARDEFESTGIGLTVVKKIVELHDGKIWVESELGKGTTFLFTIPKQQGRIQNEQLQTNSVN